MIYCLTIGDNPAHFFSNPYFNFSSGSPLSKEYQRKDYLHQRAKDEGYRSRASYKLIELDKRFNLLRSGLKVLDLGAWPGGWLQVVARKLGNSGVIVGIDLQKIEDFGGDNVHLICGDARDEENLQAMLSLAGGRFDLVISDMSPKLTGIREVDSAATVGCAELALYLAQQSLRQGGNLVIKLFKSNDSEQFVKSMRPMFNKVKRVELDATRSSSNEFYVLGFEFAG